MFIALFIFVFVFIFAGIFALFYLFLVLVLFLEVISNCEIPNQFRNGNLIRNCVALLRILEIDSYLNQTPPIDTIVACSAPRRRSIQGRRRRSGAAPNAGHRNNIQMKNLLGFYYNNVRAI